MYTAQPHQEQKACYKKCAELSSQLILSLTRSQLVMVNNGSRPLVYIHVYIYIAKLFDS